MNTRCYRCGWSYSLSREAIEEAAVTSAGQKAHVVHCPRCRQAIRIPMDQIMRALPHGWVPPSPVAAPPDGEPAATIQQSEAEPEGSAAAPKPKAERRHRRAGRSTSGVSAASAAKQNNQPS